MIARRSVMVGTGAAALASLMIATPLFGANRGYARPGSFDSRLQSFSSQKSPQRLLPRTKIRKSTSVIRGFYYYNGEPVWLERSQGELSVRFSAQTTKLDQKRLGRALASSARFSPASRLRRRELSRVSFKAASSAAISAARTP